MPLSENFDDPRHINNVRARRAADQAEREMYRDIERELDPRPKQTPVGMLLRALRDQSANPPKPSGGAS